MAHSPDHYHDAPIGEDLDSFRIFLFGTVAVIVTTAIVGMIAVMFYHAQEKVLAERVTSEPYTLISEIRNEQKASLNAYGVAEYEPGKKAVTIPISEAIKAVAAEYAEKGSK
jgi:hypothetical protein